jgi:hypothetical protein
VNERGRGALHKSPTLHKSAGVHKSEARPRLGDEPGPRLCT